MRSALVLFLALAACDGSGTIDPAAGDDFCAARDVLARQCVACHSGANPQGALDLTGDDASLHLVGVTGASGRVLVTPGDTANSFLYAKAAGEQGDLGTPMPPPSGLGASDLGVLRVWIEQGAPELCGTPAPDDGRHHPVGFGSELAHGPAAKLQSEHCVDCHGDDLTGGSAGVSCDTCHTQGWRTDCTFCHGGTLDETGAPPRDLYDETDADATSYPPHHAHVTDTALHAAFDCTTCHAKPEDVLTSGHVFVGDTTPGVAEVALGDGLSPAGRWDGAGGCSNLYCHGTGQGDDGAASVGGDYRSCGACHAGATSSASAWARMSGAHVDHLREGLACDACHSQVVSGSSTIRNPALHVDGAVEVQITELTWNGTTCTGVCHRQTHNGWRWN